MLNELLAFLEGQLEKRLAALLALPFTVLGILATLGLTEVVPLWVTAIWVVNGELLILLVFASARRRTHKRRAERLAEDLASEQAKLEPREDALWALRDRVLALEHGPAVTRLTEAWTVAADGTVHCEWTQILEWSGVDVASGAALPLLFATVELVGPDASEVPTGVMFQVSARVGPAQVEVGPPQTRWKSATEVLAAVDFIEPVSPGQAVELRWIFRWPEMVAHLRTPGTSEPFEWTMQRRTEEFTAAVTFESGWSRDLYLSVTEMTPEFTDARIERTADQLVVAKTVHDLDANHPVGFTIVSSERES